MTLYSWVSAMKKTECFLICVLVFWSSQLCSQPLPDSNAVHNKGECLLLVKGHTYIYGECIVGQHKDLDLTLFKGGYGAIVEFDKGTATATGYWTGPFHDSHAHDALGSLVRDGDCWINEDVKVCAYGRAHTSIGRCQLSVGGHTYISGDCPIEIYKPFGNFYLNEGCDSVSNYFASVMPDGSSSGRGAWSGNPPTPEAAVDLGELKRMGACWANDTARICAYKGRPDEAKDCHATIRAIPRGYDDSDLRAEFFEPDGQCLLAVAGRIYISGKCTVETRANAFVITGVAGAAGYQAQVSASQAGFDGAWNGSFGEPNFRDPLGKLLQVRNCWKNETTRLCVFYPTPTRNCQKQPCAWRLPDRDTKPQSRSK